MRRILILDDNLTICLMLKSWLVKRGFVAETATNVEDAITLVKDKPFDLILSDIRMPEADGFSFLSWVKRYDSDILVMMMTGFVDIESAVESMKSGAVDYIPKPIDPEILFGKIEDAFKKHNKNIEKRKTQTMFVKPPGEEYAKLFDKLHEAAEKEKHILILGDRGTGKSSAARYIYEKSMRSVGAFIVFDREDMPNKMKPAASDNAEPAIQDYLQQARGGVLFVKSIENFDTFEQDAILRAITTQKKDESFTQIILCTDKSKNDLKKELIPKLYQYLEKDAITMPSLNGNKEEILFFAHHFLIFANIEVNKNIRSFSPEVEHVLVTYSWPGNIQEIKNTILKAALNTRGTEVPKEIAPELLKNKIIDPVVEEDNALINVKSLRKENYEREKIKDALDLAKWNKTMAASILNIDRKTLYNKIKQYKLEVTN
ncbi:MAG: response regulator [Petrimonas sp.]|nr:response regulator [Petrimonas sp.]